MRPLVLILRKVLIHLNNVLHEEIVMIIFIFQCRYYVLQHIKSIVVSRLLCVVEKLSR